MQASCGAEQKRAVHLYKGECSYLGEQYRVVQVYQGKGSCRELLRNVQVYQGRAATEQNSTRLYRYTRFRAAA